MDTPPPLTVRVPATTSNLGPGFDCLGLALSLELGVTLRASSSAAPGEVRVRADGVDGWPLAGDAGAGEDLLVRALRAGLARFGGGAGEAGLELAVASEIPIARGLGSSGAAVVAGLLLAAELAPARPSRAELLALAIELEGHPDNAAPALEGGLCLASADGPRPRVVRYEPHASLGFAVAWPPTRLATSEARALLPERVTLADAVANARGLALLLEGLRSGDPELLRLGEADRLHVPHRLPRIPGGATALAAARAAGAYLATVSGSGTALFAIGPRGGEPPIAEAMRSALDLARAGGAQDTGAPAAVGRAVQVVGGPARVTRLPS